MSGVEPETEPETEPENVVHWITYTDADGKSHRITVTEYRKRGL